LRLFQALERHFNAIKFTPTGGAVEIRISQRDGMPPLPLPIQVQAFQMKTEKIFEAYVKPNLRPNLNPNL